MAKSKPTPKSTFAGRWRIVSMIAWTWDGNDEMDPAQGRGWAVVKGDELHGLIFFHGSDESEFVAKKKAHRPKEK